MRRAAMRAAAVKYRTAAADGGYAMVAVWKSDLAGSDIDPLHGVFGERATNRGWGPWFVRNLALRRHHSHPGNVVEADPFMQQPLLSGDIWQTVAGGPGFCGT
jgi:hypothetical protein